MLLSDAIALGRTTVSKLVAGRLEGCALGMAANAAGIDRVYSEIEKKWPWLRVPQLRCIVCGLEFEYHSYTLAIAHFFDGHVLNRKDKTLDQLIDWVRSVEPAEPVASVVEEAKEAVHVNTRF